MKIKLDENMPVSLVAVLAELGHDIDTVQSEGIAGTDDDCVWKASQQAERFFITQDLDFSDTRRFAPGTHNGILVIRLRYPGKQALYHRIVSLFTDEDTTNWIGCFIVVTEHKLRIIRP